jgi:hypothetical protein
MAIRSVSCASARRRGLCAALLLLAVAATAHAVPFHTPVIDGVITRNAATDWDPADLVVNDAADDTTAGKTANIRRLLCTWDADNLYLGVSYQDWSPDEALALYVDLGLGAGPRDASLLDKGAAAVLMPAGHTIDLVVARDPADSDASVAGPAPTVLLADADGVTTDISGDVTVAQGFNTGGEAAPGDKRVPFWFNAEIAVPWSAVYPDGLPANTVIKAVALVPKEARGLLPQDIAPNNTGRDDVTGSVLAANLHASVVDADGDGSPDPADAQIAGTVTLPDDNGAAVTASARLVGFAGRDPGAALSSVTLAAGVREFSLPRLVGGTYDITIEAEGYLDGALTASVAASGSVAGQDLTLQKATALRGTVGFATGDGAPGTVTLLDDAGDVVAVRATTVAAPDYVFYLEAGGRFTVRAEAENYIAQEQAVDVTFGVDVEGVDFALVLQTRISGTVAFESGPGAAGTVRLLDADGVQVDFADFANTGGGFTFYTAEGGSFTLSAKAPTYITTTLDVDVTLGTDVTGLELVLPRAALVSGLIGFEGPAAAGRLEVTNQATGALADTLAFSAEGDPFGFYLEPGAYLFASEAAGYVPLSPVIDVGLDDLDLGRLEHVAVRADHLEIVSAEGVTLSEVRGTVSIPGDDLWFPTLVTLAARDAAGRDDLYDLDGNLLGFGLSARKMDDLSLPRGEPGFWTDSDRSQPLSAVDFTGGRASFWMTDTAVEVLRVYLAQPAKDPIAGRIVLAFLDPEPQTVVLTASADTLRADGVSEVTVAAQLYDSAQNPARLPDIPVTFAVAPSSTGAGQFETATVTTNGDGLATARLSATGAGMLDVTATVVVNNRVLDVAGGSLGSGDTVLRLAVLPGEAAGWRLSLTSSVSDLSTPVPVTAQAIDVYGNAVPRQGLGVAFSAEPAQLGSFSPAGAVSDTAGRATVTFVPAGAAGLVTINAAGGALGDAQIGLRLRDVFVVPDPVWYDEPRTRQVFPPTDLTALVVDNTPSELLLEIPFASDWSGLQLHVIFETGFDAAGATRDPFEQPVNYGHEQKPDYAIVCKYSAYDYGDFRRFNKIAQAWEWYDPASDSYNGSSGTNILPDWTTKTGDTFYMRIPFAPFGGRPDSLRVEAYLTQDDGVKRSAFDTAPQDSSLNLTFDYIDPDPNDWNQALGPVTLAAWSPTYVVKTDFPTPPAVSNVQVTPAEADAGAVITLTARIADAGDGIGDVLADLSAMGGSPFARMYDDGAADHGDAAAGDGVYSLRTTIPLGNPGGRQELVVRAFDAGNLLPREETASLVVTALIDPLVRVEDPVGDDHGPNQAGTARKYYTYPTNIVFGPGSFDLTDLTVFETSAIVGGETIEMIAFQVGLGDFPDPADPQTADWNPLYAEINIQKIDILIDSAPGGATATLPNRQAAFQPWDAWDYAIIMDGWYKAVIPSLGQNTLDSWRANAKRTDQDILLVSDPALDTVTALVSKAALGDPTAEDIRSWDMAVLVSSHDFGGEEVLGGIRWVNEARSEWNFGGGQNSDRDANVMDLLLVPGNGHQAGLSQEEILDYESPQALARLENGLTPVAIEMSQFEDTGPPVIDTGTGGKVVTTITPLEDASVAMTVKITDDYRVDRAVLRYRSTSFGGDGWDREVAMGALANDLWVTDILPSWLDSNLVYSPVDSSRYLEFEVVAWDALGKTAASPVTTLELRPSRTCLSSERALDTDSFTMLKVDGSGLVMEEPLRSRLVEAHLAGSWTGGELPAGAEGEHVNVVFDLCNVPEGVRDAQAVPPARPLGVFRTFYLATADSLGGFLDQAGKLPAPAKLSLHYPQALVPSGPDEVKIGLYEYTPASDRWVLVGGNANPNGNNVTATVGHTGTYGLFLTDALGYTEGEVISGISISPNPFSPNGDGLYDETNISFYLDREATVTVEIYNINGDRKRVLTEVFPYTGDDLQDRVPRRVPGLVWDGRDHAGRVVPYGVYVLRILTTFNQAGGQRTIRSNHSLAVIK